MTAKLFKSEEFLKGMLRGAGLKATPGRILLLQVLQKAGRPLSIQSILSGLKSRKLNKATAYRTMETLTAKGIVHRVDLRHGHADYELALDDHHHLVCTVCGRLEDFGDCGLNKLARKVAEDSKDFARVDRHSLELFGLCKACAMKEAKTKRT